MYTTFCGYVANVFFVSFSSLLLFFLLCFLFFYTEQPPRRRRLSSRIGWKRLKLKICLGIRVKKEKSPCSSILILIALKNIGQKCVPFIFANGYTSGAAGV